MFSFSPSNFKTMLEKSFNLSYVNENPNNSNADCTGMNVPSPSSTQAETSNARPLQIRTSFPLPATSITSIVHPKTASRSSVAVLKPVPQSSSTSSPSALTSSSTARPLVRVPFEHPPSASISVYQPTLSVSAPRYNITIRPTRQPDKIPAVQPTSLSVASLSRQELLTVSATPATSASIVPVKAPPLRTRPPPAKVARNAGSSSVHSAANAARASSCELIDEAAPGPVESAAAAAAPNVNTTGTTSSDWPRHPTRPEAQRAVQLLILRVKTFQMSQHVGYNLVKV